MGPMGTYTLFKQGDREVCGMMKAQPGQPTAWLPYARVEHADGTADKAKSAGGKVVVPPTDIPNVGRFFMAIDAQGAALGYLQRAPGAPAESGAPQVGEWSWDELLTGDCAAAAKFYAAVMGWKAVEPKAGDSHGYWHFSHDGQKGDVGGMMKLPLPNVPPHWLSYVHVAKLDDAHAKAQKLGAKEAMKPQDIPNTGRFSVLMDPQGAAFALYQPTGAH
jgi:hypothetical protein